MFKSMNFIINYYPLIINILMIFFMMWPSKNIINPAPLMFLIMLIFMTLLISLKMNFFSPNWMPFILFLMMIGGLIIIFMYLTSLCNNEFFFYQINKITLNLMKILPFMIILIYMNFNWELSIFNLNYLDIWSLNLNLNQKIFNYLYMENLTKSTHFIMFYLYYSMICIMNICYKFKAPLRQMIF